MTFLCIASFDKGHDFLREAKRLGCTVLLVTSLSLKDKARWPEVDEIFYMPDVDKRWDRTQTLNAISYLARSRQIDRIVALDDFDVEVAAMLREHLRVPGMGETTVRYFRDKLAMRMRAREARLAVPEFVHVLNYGRIREFTERVPGPWLVKPRSSAGAIGIKKVQSVEELWPLIESLGDEQSQYVMEQFVPGDIFHVDTIVCEREVRFAIASGYGRPPLSVSHEGGVFTTRILERESQVARELLEANARVMESFGLVRGVSHTEFIKAHADGRVYFLETSARVGGAHIADLIEAATGLNMWAEWAKLEASGEYAVAAPRTEYAGLLVSLAKQQWPDTSGYDDPEVVWRMADREHHVGLIVRSPNAARVRELLDEYTARVQQDFWAYVPPVAKATS